jgi:hypothetical protein
MQKQRHSALAFLILASGADSRNKGLLAQPSLHGESSKVDCRHHHECNEWHRALRLLILLLSLCLGGCYAKKNRPLDGSSSASRRSNRSRAQNCTHND